MKRSSVTAAVFATIVATSLVANAHAESQEDLRCVDRLKVVKATVDKAPPGPKKDAALTQYILAQKSYSGLGREK